MTHEPAIAYAFLLSDHRGRAILEDAANRRAEDSLPPASAETAAIAEALIAEVPDVPDLTAARLIDHAEHLAAAMSAILGETPGMAALLAEAGVES